MPTTYKSILLAQPADSQVVFMRRFTRDPPVLAQWDATNTQFSVPAGSFFTVVGGPDSGSLTASYTTNFLELGRKAWQHIGATYTTYVQFSAGQWRVGQANNAASAGYEAAGQAWSGGTITANAFTPFGGPGFGAPTSITLTGALPFPLIIPANLVQAWRPQ